MLIGQLIRVQLHRQTMLARTCEYPLGLRGRERDRFAERIDRIGRVRRRDRWNHFAANIINVGVVAIGEFRR